MGKNNKERSSVAERVTSIKHPFVKVINTYAHLVNKIVWITYFCVLKIYILGSEFLRTHETPIFHYQTRRKHRFYIVKPRETGNHFYFFLRRSDITSIVYIYSSLSYQIKIIFHRSRNKPFNCVVKPVK